MDKFKEMQRRIDAGTLNKPADPCQLCNQPAATDGSTTFEYHDEDYGHDYRWSALAAYVLRRGCHIHRLHQRFARPLAWQSFLPMSAAAVMALRGTSPPNLDKLVRQL